MKRLAEIVNDIKVFYRNIEISSFAPVSSYAQFVISAIDNEERHTAALALHTGSIFYQAMLVAVATLACLSDKKIETNELVSSLSIGDKLLIDGKRAIFLGIKCGKDLNPPIPNEIDYFIYECNGITYLPISSLSTKNIDLYNGNAVTLDGRGIKTTLNARKKFLSFIFDQSEKSDISTVISRSVAIITDKETAEEIYKNTKIKYNQTSVNLDELVTASYFTENDDYQMGNNPTKEEPVLKFYSRASACREAVIADKQKRFLGCIACDESIWLNNSEIEDIAARKSLKFSIFSGRTHYTYYDEWLHKEDFKFYIPVPEITEIDLSNKRDSRPELSKFKYDLGAFADRKIHSDCLTNICSVETMIEIKKRLLQLKNDLPDSRDKEDFLVNCYFIINLCRAAFFPLKYYDEMAEAKVLSTISLHERFHFVKFFAEELGDCNKEYALFVYHQLQCIVESLYQDNPKGNYIVSAIGKRQIDCIVAPKAYYESIFLYWLKSENLHFSVPPIMTISVYEKASKIFNNVVFITGYYDFRFNPYADFGFRQAKVLYFGFENLQVWQLCRISNQGKSLIFERNSLHYNYVAENTDELPALNNTAEQIEEECESVLKKLCQDLQLNNAYRYAHLNSGNTGETLAEVKMIISFASGSVGYFTKQYKAYRLSADSASETDLENLKVGDSLIFTKESENKDIVDVILRELLTTQYKNTKYPLLYENSLVWKKEIREYMKTNDLTYQAFADRLQSFGCNRHQVTVRSWLYEETHIVGPRDVEDYAAVFNAIGFNALTPAEVKDACDEIRSLRMKILGLLGKAIVRNAVSENKEPLWREILGNAERLSQTEQIISITYEHGGLRLPISMVNKPCAI